MKRKMKHDGQVWKLGVCLIVVGVILVALSFFPGVFFITSGVLLITT